MPPTPSTAPGDRKRVPHSVEVVVLVSDYEVVFCVPHQDRRMGYSGFRVRDPVLY